MKYGKLSAAVLGLLLLVGCEDMGNLYPANAQAEKLGGDMAAHFTSFGTGNGTIEAIGPGGEVLKGNYGPALVDYPFGAIFKEVNGQYSTNPAKADNGTPTVAKLTGTMGTTLDCEFYNDDRTNNGFGGCKSVTGALYRLQY